MLFIKCKNNGIVANPFQSREITHAFHDVDGTHSLIREWLPVMSMVLFDVIENGLPDKYDSDENIKRLVGQSGEKSLPETDKFCIESAGLSALTQMEWAIRRAIQNNKVDINCDKNINAAIIDLIWNGNEINDDLHESQEINVFLDENTPRLFKFYEKILNGFCRDSNLAKARKNPEEWRVKGSLEFIKFLKDSGVRNYFITGAVVEKGMGMYEEIESLGYEIGENCLVENVFGSTWSEKVPKNMIMMELCERFKIRGENIIVVGDGRSEIQAGIKMNSVTISRLPSDAIRQRELHRQFGTNLIVEDFSDLLLYDLFEIEKGE